MTPTTLTDRSTQPMQKLTLGLGSTHPDVVELQERLNLYVANPKVAGGVFDSLTEYAVRLFQFRMFLTQDGIVGPNTWRALYDGAPVTMPLLRVGDRNSAVRLLQDALSVAGYGFPTGEDLFENPTVRRSVVAFQYAKGLVSDGIVGPNTWHALSKTRLEDPTQTGTITRIEKQVDQKLHAAEINSIAIEPFDPNRSIIRRVATGSGDTTVRFWQSSGESLDPVYRGDRGSVSSVAYDPERPLLWSSTFGGTVRLCDYLGNTLLVFPARGGSVMTLATDPTSGNIVTANGDNALRFFRPNGDLIWEQFLASAIQSVAFSKRGQLATASNSHGANLWDEPFNPQGRSRNISSTRFASAVQFNPEGTKLAVARGTLLQMYSDQLHALTSTQCPSPITSLSFSQSGRYLAMGTQDGKIYIFDLQARYGLGDIVFGLDGHEESVSAIAFSHTPEFTLHSGDVSGRLITWGIGKGSPITA